MNKVTEIIKWALVIGLLITALVRANYPAAMGFFICIVQFGHIAMLDKELDKSRRMRGGQ